LFKLDTAVAQGPVNVMGKPGSELPYKTIGSIPSGFTGVGGMSPEDALAKWETAKQTMSAEEIKALGDPIELNVYDVDKIGKSFGLTEEQMGAVKGGEFGGEWTDEMRLTRGIGSMFADPNNLIDLEGNYDAFNLMNKMAGQATLDPYTNPAGRGTHTQGLAGQMARQFSGSRRGGEIDPAQYMGRAETNLEQGLQSQTVGQLYGTAVDKQKDALKKSFKKDSPGDYVGMAMPAIMTTLATAGFGGVLAPALLATPALSGLGGALGGLGLGLETATLGGIAGKAAMAGGKSLAGGIAGNLRYQTPGQGIKAGGGIASPFNQGMMDAEFAANQANLNRYLLGGLKRGGGPLTSSRQQGAV
jgi:hypothetical protein